MSSQPKLEIVGGTEAEKEIKFDNASTSEAYVPSRLLTSDGDQFYRRAAKSNTPGGGDGGDVTPLWKLDIPRDVQIAKWGLATLAGACGVALWAILAQIDNRFDRADDKITRVSETVGNLRVEIAEQRGDIKAILEKLDDQPEKSTGGE